MQDDNFTYNTNKSLNQNVHFSTMNNYKILGRIGQGAHGYVVKATNRKTKATVALKKINFKRVSKGEIPKNVMREITALTVLSSKYVRFEELF